MIGARRLVYVWQIPVRVTHWTIALCITVLAVTGFFIGHPYASGGMVMLWMRATHLVFAVLLTCTVIWRVAWAFMGNEWSSWRAFIPFATPGWWDRAFSTAMFYGFLRRKAPPDVGHNPLAATAYVGVYLLFVVEIITGFAMNANSWGGWWYVAFGWVFALLPANDVRLTHHLVMWLLLGFVVHHVYSSVLMDNEERTGILSSIVNGFKFVRRER